jgi:hypothetical protein
MQRLLVSLFIWFLLLVSDSPSAHLRHRALQLALIFMCSIGQLSPGAYFLRRDFFPSIASVRLFNTSFTSSIIIILYKACKIAWNGPVCFRSHTILGYSCQLSQVWRSQLEPLFETYQKLIRRRLHASTLPCFKCCSSNCHQVCQ